MKTNRILFLGVLVALSLLLSACGSAFEASSWPGITYDEASQIVYLAYNQQVYALQAENGVESWRFPPEPNNNVTFFAPPALGEDGQLIVSGYDNALYSLDPSRNGAQNWAFEGARNRFIAPPLSNAEGIFAPNSDHTLYALTPEGEPQWTFTSREPQWGGAASDGDTIFLPSMDHMLYALDAQTGDLLWEQDLGGTVVGSPALSQDGMLYIGTFGREVVAVSARNGSVQWRSPTEDWVWGAPTLADGVVYAGDLQGNVYAFDAEDGNELWRVSASSAVTGSPLVFNEHIYVSSESGEVLSIDLEGRIQWTQSFTGQAYSSPVAAGELILIGLVESESGKILLALDGNGSEVWSFTPES